MDETQKMKQIIDVPSIEDELENEEFPVIEPYTETEQKAKRFIDIWPVAAILVVAAILIGVAAYIDIRGDNLDQQHNTEIEQLKTELDGLKTETNELQTTISERDQTITDLNERIDILTTTVDEQAQEITALSEAKAEKERQQTYYEQTYTAPTESYTYSNSSGVLTASKGVNYYNGYKETYYSQKVLPGGGLNIPGRHVAEDGTVRDIDGYICVASSDLEYGSVVETSLGTGKVYDSGCDSGVIDIYTNW